MDDADVIIIGSGPAGAAFARTVANDWPAARLLMLEAGPQVTSPPGNHVSNLPDPAQRREAELASQGPKRGVPYAPITQREWTQRISGTPDTAMLRRPGLFAVGRGEPDGDGFPAGHGASNVGGMGVHWFGGCPRPALSERVTFIEAAMMEAALDEGDSMLRSSADQYPDSPIALLLERRVGELFNSGRPPDRRVQPMPMALQRTPSGFIKTGPDIMLGDLLEAAPDRFELRPETICRRILFEGRRATGVEVFDVASGTLSQVRARIVAVAADSLHTPQVLFASGIRPPALGHYLNEHLQVGLMAELDGATPSAVPAGVTWVPCLGDSFPFSITITEATDSMLPFGTRGADPTKPVIFISLFSASDLDFDNRVDFSSTEVDWRGLPELIPHLRPTPGDLERVEFAKSVVSRIANAIGQPLPGVTFMRFPYGSSLHYQGTVRMGEADDGTSVCDRDSRVWGFDNLYVAGNGVIPTVTATNPTLTSVALSILAAHSAAATGRSAT